MSPLSAVLSAAVAALAAVAIAPPAAGGVDITRDVPYGPAPLSLDLYEPDPEVAPAAGGEDGLRPAVVWIHGGGWASGHKAMPSAASYSGELAARGYVAASVDYRLLAWGGCPRAPGCAAAMAAAKEDVERAVRWLRAHHRELGVDPRRIALGGSSAGAITAMLVGTDPAPGARVSAVVSLSGGLPADAHVDHRAAPALLLHGTADARLSPLWSIRAAERLRAAGAIARLRLIPGGPHDLWLEHADEATRRMSAFLAEQLAEPLEPPHRRRARLPARVRR